MNAGNKTVNYLMKYQDNAFVRAGVTPALLVLSKRIIWQKGATRYIKNDVIYKGQPQVFATTNNITI